jgi:hypothetical protein
VDEISSIWALAQEIDLFEISLDRFRAVLLRVFEILTLFTNLRIRKPFSTISRAVSQSGD